MSTRATVRISLAMVLAIITPAVAGADRQTTGAPKPRPQAAAAPAEVEERVKAAELQRQRALIAADYDALDALLADDLVYTHSNAKVDTKTSYFEPLRSGRTRYQGFESSDLKVRVYGSTAIVTGEARSTALVAGQESKTVMRFTNVWIERGGRWQMVAWQSTRLP